MVVSSGMARDKMFTIRVDEAEHALFKGAAAAVPVSISEYARDAMLARMALEEGLGGSVRGRGLDGGGSAADAGGNDQLSTEGQQVGSIPTPPAVIKSPGDVPVAVRRAASREEARAFAPDPKVGKSQGRGPKPVKPWDRSDPVQSCRHGLMRCKVCGTL